MLINQIDTILSRCPVCNSSRLKAEPRIASCSSSDTISSFNWWCGIISLDISNTSSGGRFSNNRRSICTECRSTRYCRGWLGCYRVWVCCICGACMSMFYTVGVHLVCSSVVFGSTQYRSDCHTMSVWGVVVSGRLGSVANVMMFPTDWHQPQRCSIAP